MFRFARRHLSYADVVATLALFVALGGTSYAAIKLPKDSVGSRQISKGAVGTAEIRYRSITPSKLTSDALQPRHVSPRFRRLVERLAVAATPPSEKLFYATVARDGTPVTGNALRVERSGATNEYGVRFSETGSGPSGRCVPVASLSADGHATATMGPGEQVDVSTFDRSGNPSERAFSVLVTCTTGY